MNKNKNISNLCKAIRNLPAFMNIFLRKSRGVKSCFFILFGEWCLYNKSIHDGFKCRQRYICSWVFLILLFCLGCNNFTKYMDYNKTIPSIDEVIREKGVFDTVVPDFENNFKWNQKYSQNFNITIDNDNKENDKNPIDEIIMLKKSFGLKIDPNALKSVFATYLFTNCLKNDFDNIKTSYIKRLSKQIVDSIVNYSGIFDIIKEIDCTEFRNSVQVTFKSLNNTLSINCLYDLFSDDAEHYLAEMFKNKLNFVRLDDDIKKQIVKKFIDVYNEDSYDLESLISDLEGIETNNSSFFDSLLKNLLNFDNDKATKALKYLYLDLKILTGEGLSTLNYSTCDRFKNNDSDSTNAYSKVINNEIMCNGIALKSGITINNIMVTDSIIAINSYNEYDLENEVNDNTKSTGISFNLDVEFCTNKRDLVYKNSIDDSKTHTSCSSDKSLFLNKDIMLKLYKNSCIKLDDESDDDDNFSTKPIESVNLFAHDTIVQKSIQNLSYLHIQNHQKYENSDDDDDDSISDYESLNNNLDKLYENSCILFNDNESCIITDITYLTKNECDIIYNDILTVDEILSHPVFLWIIADKALSEKDKSIYINKIFNKINKDVHIDVLKQVVMEKFLDEEVIKKQIRHFLINYLGRPLNIDLNNAILQMPLKQITISANISKKWLNDGCLAAQKTGKINFNFRDLYNKRVNNKMGLYSDIPEIIVNGVIDNFIKKCLEISIDNSNLDPYSNCCLQDCLYYQDGDINGHRNMNYINQLIIDSINQINFIIDIIPTKNFLDKLGEFKDIYILIRNENDSRKHQSDDNLSLSGNNNVNLNSDEYSKENSIYNTLEPLEITMLKEVSHNYYKSTIHNVFNTIDKKPFLPVIPINAIVDSLAHSLDNDIYKIKFVFRPIKYDCFLRDIYIYLKFFLKKIKKLKRNKKSDFIYAFNFPILNNKKFDYNLYTPILGLVNQIKVLKIGGSRYERKF